MRRWSPAGEQALAALARETWGPGALVLDAGVGSGLTALAVARGGVRLVGVDVSRAMLAALVARRDTALPVLRADTTALPVRGASVGGVLVSNVLHHVPDWRAALAEWVRVTRPGGALVLNLGDGGSEGEVAGVVDRFWAELGDAAVPVPSEQAGLTAAAVEDELVRLGAPLAGRRVVDDVSSFTAAEVVGWAAANPWLHGAPADDGVAVRRAAVSTLAWARDVHGDAPLRRTRHVLFRVHRLPRA